MTSRLSASSSVLLASIAALALGALQCSSPKPSATPTPDPTTAPTGTSTPAPMGTSPMATSTSTAAPKSTAKPVPQMSSGGFCERVDLAKCNPTAKWLMGCKDGVGPDGGVEKVLVADVVSQMGTCMISTPSTDDMCQGQVRSCVRDTVMAAAKPTPADEQTCEKMIAACTKANAKMDYTYEQCVKIVSASQPGAVRQQVEQAMGVKTCSVKTIWSTLPIGGAAFP